MVTHNLKYPELCFVGDEVGGNTSMIGDGHKGGDKFVVGKGFIPKIKSATTDSHFTVMGLTNLKGTAVMCILILSCLKEKLVNELGIDASQNVIGDVSDKDFFKNNMGKDKIFPCGPTCTYEGKEILCFVRWSEKGSMTSEILRDAIADLDVQNVIPRQNNVSPFLLLDGHGSRFQLLFLQYINEPSHPWVVCIGVPYRTSYWQVGDSTEQNGCYKMYLGEAKKRLVEMKYDKYLNFTIGKHEIIKSVKTAWDKSFARTVTNKNAIAERRWFPLNCNLLCIPEIKNSMTDGDK